MTRRYITAVLVCLLLCCESLFLELLLSADADDYDDSYDEASNGSEGDASNSSALKRRTNRISLSQLTLIRHQLVVVTVALIASVEVFTGLATCRTSWTLQALLVVAFFAICTNKFRVA